MVCGCCGQLNLSTAIADLGKTRETRRSVQRSTCVVEYTHQAVLTPERPVKQSTMAQRSRKCQRDTASKNRPRRHRKPRLTCVTHLGEI
ncbi:hypothetical protein BaRGS_00020322 [Batillaria attramentaria]|uniref:Uncharacterized protein n=1 Tax=Batillaria attramentaria TaxID=370345 RepID=A0ABD0KM50_9CAEN